MIKNFYGFFKILRERVNCFLSRLLEQIAGISIVKDGNFPRARERGATPLYSVVKFLIISNFYSFTK
jgi:hypothetical protein